jgi:hypothetical protein
MRFFSIEILEPALEEECLNVLNVFSADLHPVLWSEVRFCRPPKNCSFVLVYGGDTPIIYKVFFPQKYLQDICANILVLVLRFLRFFRSALNGHSSEQMKRNNHDRKDCLVHTPIQRKYKSCHHWKFHAQGSILGIISFLRFLPIFGEQKLAFFSKTNVVINFCKTSSCLSKKTPFFPIYLAKVF